MLTVAELHARGIAEGNAGRLRRARGLLERAVARAEGEQLARVQVSLAYALADLGEQERALRLCTEVADDPAAPVESRGVAESQRAVLLLHAARLAEALDAFGRAVDWLRGGDDVHLGRVYLNRGVLHLQLQRPTEAERDFALSTDHFTAAGLAVEAAKAEHNLGYARLLVGDLVGALQAMDAARAVLAPLSPAHEATCDQDRAEVLFAAGQVTQGRAALETAAAAYGAQRLRRHQAEAELALARRLLVSDPAEAERWARRAARRFRSGGQEAWASRAAAAELAAAVAQGRRAPRLLDEAERVAAALAGQGLTWEARAAELAGVRVRLARGEHDEAAAGVRRRRLSRRAPLDVRLAEREVRAELAARSGRRGEALGHLRQGLADLAGWQSSFGSLDLQTNVVGLGARLAARGLELATGSPDDRVLFEWSERARMLASRVQPVRAPADPELGAALAELRDSPTPDREAALRQRIQERAWHREGSGEVTEPLALDELRAALGDRVLVSHVVAGDTVTALVVRAEGVTRVPLTGRRALADLLGGLLPDLDVAAGELPGALGRAVRGDLVARLARLAAVLVEPVAALVGARPVVLTPSALLAGVPWSLLPGLVGRPVTVAQSATSWAGRSSAPWRAGRAGLIAGPRVARAGDEVRAVAKEWQVVDCLVGPEATAAAASSLAAGVDVLHVAAHGRHAAESPLFSGVQLADGTWFGYDVDQLAAVPDVVLLSACEVGRSTVRWGEELIGMTTAWLHAGARCVIASPAAVADEAAYDALVRVHRALAAGSAPAEALAGAVPAASADAPPAPFVCFG